MWPVCPKCNQYVYHWYKDDDGNEHWFCDDCNEEVK